MAGCRYALHGGTPFLSSVVFLGSLAAQVHPTLAPLLHHQDLCELVIAQSIACLVHVVDCLTNILSLVHDGPHLVESLAEGVWIDPF